MSVAQGHVKVVKRDPLIAFASVASTCSSTPEGSSTVADKQIAAASVRLWLLDKLVGIWCWWKFTR